MPSTPIIGKEDPVYLVLNRCIAIDSAQFRINLKELHAYEVNDRLQIICSPKPLRELHTKLSNGLSKDSVVTLACIGPGLSGPGGSDIVDTVTNMIKGFPTVFGDLRGQ